jgi:hypothetical protein
VNDAPHVRNVYIRIVDALYYGWKVRSHFVHVGLYSKETLARERSVKSTKLHHNELSKNLALEDELKHVSSIRRAGQQLDLVLGLSPSEGPKDSHHLQTSRIPDPH